MCRLHPKQRLLLIICLGWTLLAWLQAPAFADEPNGQSKQAPAAAEALRPPFATAIEAPEFPKDLEWLNTGGPIRLRDLEGKFVLLDFWTYCCINCIHILPELKKLEKQFPNELVVIGVHSAKFDTEKESKNIEEAVLRYQIEHPVVNDANHRIWQTYGVNSWPSIVLIDPEGNFVGRNSGEFKAEQIAPVLKGAMPYYRQRGTLDESPIRFDLLAYSQEPTPLRFPGKVLADEASGRLFISDSNHHRIVVADLQGKLQEIIGSGAVGANDGNYQQATFNQPQGMALHGETLYVADTENHLLRKVDLKTKRVVTIAGVGSQAPHPWPGLERLGPRDRLPKRWVGPPLQTGLNSPWDVLVHQEDLYIAMAGPHQIWKMPLDESEIGPYAGNGREDIVDGPLLPQRPYAEGSSSFAQPSGLATDGKWLFVADSEGSSVRAVPFYPQGSVLTVVGTSSLPRARLFTFGDKDGNPSDNVRLQHVLGVVWHNGALYIADTYNSKIKKIVPALPDKQRAKIGKNYFQSCTTIAGDGAFDEPAGLTYASGKLYVADTNNHVIRVVDLENEGKVSTLNIEGLKPPTPVERDQTPAFTDAVEVRLKNVSTVAPVEGKVRLNANLELPRGWKINPLAPMRYLVEVNEEAGPFTLPGEGKLARVDEPSTSIDISLPVTGEGEGVATILLRYYYCQEGGEGVCKVGSVAWTVPLKVDEASSKKEVVLKHDVPEGQ